MSLSCAALLTIIPPEGSVDESKPNDGGEDETKGSNKDHEILLEYIDSIGNKIWTLINADAR